MNSAITGEKKYISALEAGRLIGVSRDYIGRLCRQKVLRGKRIGKFWIVDEDSVKNYAYSVVQAKIERRDRLVKARTAEYSAQKGPSGVVRAPHGEEGRRLDNKISSLDRWHLQRHTTDALDFLHAQTKNPVTFSAAAHMIPPATAHQFGDTLHKIISLITIFILVFGSYGMVDHRYATFARDALYDVRTTITGMPEILARGFDIDTATSRTEQLATALASGVADFSTENFTHALSMAARTVHGRVDAIISPLFIDIGDVKSVVEVEIMPLNVSY